ncbi:MAG: B-4DMT family transporter [Rhodococcus sp. (in: high G+C Gram-positive bacteria)]
MTGWVVRGIGMCLINVGVRIVLGVAVTQWPLHGSQLRWLGIAVVLLAVFVWAGIDGIRDRRANPDPEYGADLTMIWLKAAVLGGLAAGLVTWLIQLVVDFSLGQNTLVFELTSGAAFTILVIFVPATLAVFLGRLLAGREANKKLAASDSERDSKRRDRHKVGAGAVSGSSAQQASGSAVQNDRTQDNQTRWADDNADTEVFQAIDSNAADPRAGDPSASSKHRDNT